MTPAARPHRAPSPARLALVYTLAAYGGSWACWGAATALTVAFAGGLAAAASGVLQVLGTLVPLLATYALFPQVRACGLRGLSPLGGGDDPRAGFWRYVFGGRPGARGLAAFFALFVWRWAMFRLAFGFPATPADALANAWHNLPLLFLGGGLEEVGWRGCLQPALAAALAAPRAGRRGAPDPAQTPVTTVDRAALPLPTAVRRGALPRAAAAVATGAVWGLWHLPLFVLPGAFQNNLPVWSVVLAGVVLSCSFGALDALARNLALCVASHAWYNAMLVAVPSFGPISFALFAAEAAAGLAVLCFVPRTGTPPGTNQEEQLHETRCSRIV
jgi:hypothetical protein